MHDPAWLFLDEPTAGLDPRGRLSMLDLVKDLAAHKGFGVILSTHLLADVKAVCEEIVVLRDGRLLDHGRVDADAESAEAVYVLEGFGDEDAFRAALKAEGVDCKEDGRLIYASVPVEEGPRGVLAAAQASSYSLRRLQRKTETLEDLFFKLVDESGDEAAGVLGALTGRDGEAN